MKYYISCKNLADYKEIMNMLYYYNFLFTSQHVYNPNLPNIFEIDIDNRIAGLIQNTTNSIRIYHSIRKVEDTILSQMNCAINFND